MIKKQTRLHAFCAAKSIFNFSRARKNDISYGVKKICYAVIAAGAMLLFGTAGLSDAGCTELDVIVSRVLLSLFLIGSGAAGRKLSCLKIQTKRQKSYIC